MSDDAVLTRVGRLARSLALGFALPVLLGATLAVPTTLTFQGRLLDDAGDALSGPVASLILSLYDGDTSAATLLYSETHTNVPLDDSGGFAVHLGAGTVASGTPAHSSSLYEGGSVFVEISIDAETLSPRQQFHAAPYALIAENANAVQGVDVVATQTTIQSGLSTVAGKADTALTLANAANAQANVAVAAASAIDASLGTTPAAAASVAERLASLEEELAHNFSSASLASVGGWDGLDLAPIQIGSQILIPHQNPADLRLYLIACPSLDCTSSTRQLIDSFSADVGRSVSAAIGPTGGIMMAYYDAVGLDLKFASCAGDPTCSGSIVLRTLDTAGDVGSHTELVVSSLGAPLIFHHDETNGDLEAFACSGTACIAGVPTTLVSTGNVGEAISALLAPDNLARVVYRDETTPGLGFVRCGNDACTSSTAHLVDSGVSPDATSMAIGNDGIPIIAYRDAVQGNLKVIHCGDADCSATTTTTLDASGKVGAHVALAIGADGLPVIAYRDDDSASLRIARCLEETCALFTLTSPEEDDDVGTEVALVVDAPKTEYVFYRDVTNSEIRRGSFSSLPTQVSAIAAQTVANQSSLNFSSGLRLEHETGGGGNADLQLGGFYGVIEAVDEATTNLILRSNSDVYIQFDADNSSGTRRFRIQANTTLLTTDTLFEVDESGRVYADGGYNCGNSITGTGTGGTLTEADLEAGPCLSDNGPADFAELLPAEAGVGPGDVLAIDPHTGLLVAATAEDGSRVVGVHSTRPSYLGNARFGTSTEHAALAITGVVPVKVVAGETGVRPGDFLVASDQPGYARPCPSESRCEGIIVGRALEALPSGRGRVMSLVRAR
ncbi:MAG: hypothetical protein VCB25_11425 [Myxococcota bacterium]